MTSHRGHFFSHAMTTAKQVEIVNQEAGISVEFRPTRRTNPSLRVDGGQSRSLSIWRTSSETGFSTTPKLQMDLITIRFVSTGTMLRQDHDRRHIAHSGCAMMVMFDDMRAEFASPAFESISATITRSALADAHQSLFGGNEPFRPLRFRSVVDARIVGMQAIERTMERVHAELMRGVRDFDLVFPMMEEVLAYQVLSAWPKDEVDEKRHSEHAVHRSLERAIEFIKYRISDRLLLADVAQAAGVSVRTLQLLFRSEVGKTPVQFILETRLDRVHADLRSSKDDGTSIRTVAERWGFSHMGDFGRRYRTRFGTSPSLTRRDQ